MGYDSAPRIFRERGPHALRDLPASRLVEAPMNGWTVFERLACYGRDVRVRLPSLAAGPPLAGVIGSGFYAGILL
jgi:hypothetical protein